MSILCDYHVHSTFSGDAKGSMKEMIDSAVSKGLKKICKWDNINKKCLNADRIYEEGLASFTDKYTSEEYW